MIFSVYINNDEANVDVYDDLENISNSIELQDIINSDCILIDEKGNIYNWDNSKLEEIGTIYGYTLKITNTNIELGRHCLASFETNSKAYTFDIKIK